MIKQLYKLLGVTTLFVAIAVQPSFAGKELTEEGIKLEISYLAKQLLDISGKDSYTLESSAVVKPFIGICTNPSEAGIQLTCITPDSQADKAGLLTGDVITEINGLSVTGKESHKDHHKGNYWTVLKSIKPGDELKMTLEREGKSRAIDVTVGSLSHPAYSCDINKE